VTWNSAPHPPCATRRRSIVKEPTCSAPCCDLVTCAHPHPKYLRLRLVYHSTLGLRVIKKKKTHIPHRQPSKGGCIQHPDQQRTFWEISRHPGRNPGANHKSISHRCNPILVAFVWELTKETIHLPLGCLQGGFWKMSRLIRHSPKAPRTNPQKAHKIQTNPKPSRDVSGF